MHNYEDVLSANEAFYDAFGAGDMHAMENIWAKSGNVSCLHPGWHPLFNRDEILSSWQGILGNKDRPKIECLHPQVDIRGDTAVLLCYELLDSGYLLATNIFVREDEAWRMMHHHSGGPVPPPD